MTAVKMNFIPAAMKCFPMVVFLILVNCCFVLCQTEFSTTCPPPEDISPCTCYKYKYRLGDEFYCLNIHNEEQLNDVVNKSSNWTFPGFHILNSTFMYLPTDLLIKKEVTSLEVRDCNMTSLFEKAIPFNNKLKKVHLHNLVISSGLRWEHFSKLINLDHFVFNIGDVKTIDQSFIDHFPQEIRIFQIAATGMETLDDYAFSKLTKLEYLYLLDNEITTIKRSMFPQQSPLIEIGFRSSTISTLPIDIFTNMPMLKKVSFEDTNIVVLQESVFRNIFPQLTTLEFRDNEIDCNCEMKWVARVTKPRYSLVSCQKPRALKGLSIKDLMLSHFAHCG